MKMYYKLILRDGNKLRSLTAFNNEVAICYIRNQWRRAKIGGLLVFDSYTKSASFKHTNYPYASYIEIWTCEVRNPCILPSYRYLRINEIFLGKKELSAVWEQKYDSINFISKASWPPGTLAFKSVKLLERVK